MICQQEKGTHNSSIPLADTDYELNSNFIKVNEKVSNGLARLLTLFSKPEPMASLRDFRENCHTVQMQGGCSLATETVRKPSTFTRFVVVCMAACCATREAIPGNGAMNVSVCSTHMLQHLAIGAKPRALRLT